MVGLLSLIGQALVPDLAQTTQDGGEIPVFGRKSAPRPENDPAPPPMGNRSYIEEARDAAANAPKHKGMFGVKGTLRDILGTVGDAFLIQSGNKAIYAPRRQQERESDALSGFTDNPMQAIERLAQQNPTAARDLYNDFLTNQAKKAQIQSLHDARTSQSEERDYKRKQDFGNYAARLLAKADTPERYASAMKVIKTRAAALNIDPEELGISDTLTPDDRAVLGAGDMTVRQQEDIPLRRRQIDIQQQRADADTTRANRPPPPRQQRAQTELEYYKELSGVPAAKRSPEQKAFMDKFTRSGKGSKKVDIGSLPLPPGFEGLKPKLVK